MNINVLSAIGQYGIVNFPANFWMKKSGMKGLLVTTLLIIGYLAANGQNPAGRFNGVGRGVGRIHFSIARMIP